MKQTRPADTATPAGLEAPAPPAPPLDRSAAPEPVAEPRKLAVDPPPEPATPADELAVFASLRSLGADLGEPVEVTRAGGPVFVRGTGVSPAMRFRIEQELAGNPRVRVELTDPAEIAPPQRIPAPLPAERRPAAQAFEKQFANRQAYEEFSHEMLASIELLLAHVHALRRLADRFPTGVERSLDSRDRSVLDALRQDHAQEVMKLSQELKRRAQPVIRAAGHVEESTTEPASEPAEWQAATMQLLADARAAERALADMLGGTESSASAQEIAGSVQRQLSRLNTQAAAYSHLR